MLNQKKDIHVYLEENIHKILKLELYSQDLSIQEFFKEISSLLCSRDERIIQIINEYKNKRLAENISNLDNLKMKDIYDAIEKNSPFKE